MGAGAGYILMVPLLLFVASSTGTAQWPLGLVLLFTLAINTPHYGATLLRVYEQREERRKYAFFAVWVTLLLVLAFAAGSRSVLVGSVLFTLYVTWSPWHFAGQNYGLTLMFLRRRGVAIDPRLKRLLYTSFLCSFVLAFLAVHVENSSAVYAPGATAEANTLRILRLAIPVEVARLLMSIAAALYVLSLVGVALGLRRQARARELMPAAVLVLTQALWFSVPALLALTGTYTPGGLAFAAIWISSAHSLQYLWVTSYYAKRTDPSMHAVPYFVKALLAGTAVTVIPSLLFAPAALGAVAWAGGLGVLTFSVVNLHHFILDGAIWKLRDGRVARALLRSIGDEQLRSEAGTAPAGRRLLPAAIWTASALSVAVPVLNLWELTIDVPRAENDVVRMEAAARRLAWIGRDSPRVLADLGLLYQGTGQVDAAIAAYEKVLALEPSAGVNNNLAWMLAVHRGSDPESAAYAVRLAEAASQSSGHRHPGILDTLAVAYAAAGRFDDAERVATRAAALARGGGEATLAAEIEGRIPLYRSRRPYRLE